jgi:hypothetical protein
MAYLKAILTVIALLLAVLVLRPAFQPTPASAQGSYADLYIEPGTTMLRKPDGTAQLEGKVVIDLRTGDVYGFPTLTSAPYPVDVTKSKPPVSEPMHLGKFDFSKMRAAR